MAELGDFNIELLQQMQECMKENHKELQEKIEEKSRSVRSVEENSKELWEILTAIEIAQSSFKEEMK